MATINDSVDLSFVKKYHTSEIWLNYVTWMGVPCCKLPLDLWVYQEILFEKKPSLIVECGTNKGGTALFLASVLDAIGSGEVVSIDIQPDKNRPQHQRIRYIHGSSTDAAIANEIVNGKSDVMVILDSDHKKEHVLSELRLWSDLVGVGQYLIVEDGFINGNPCWPEHGPGPLEAIREFLATDNRFEVDVAREKFGATFNPSGYLKKVKHQ